MTRELIVRIPACAWVFCPAGPAPGAAWLIMAHGIATHLKELP